MLHKREYRQFTHPYSWRKVKQVRSPWFIKVPLEHGVPGTVLSADVRDVRKKSFCLKEAVVQLEETDINLTKRNQVLKLNF